MSDVGDNDFSYSFRLILSGPPDLTSGSSIWVCSSVGFVSGFISQNPIDFYRRVRFAIKFSYLRWPSRSEHPLGLTNLSRFLHKTKFLRNLKNSHISMASLRSKTFEQTLSKIVIFLKQCFLKVIVNKKFLKRVGNRHLTTPIPPMPILQYHASFVTSLSKSLRGNVFKCQIALDFTICESSRTPRGMKSSKRVSIFRHSVQNCRNCSKILACNTMLTRKSNDTIST